MMKRFLLLILTVCLSGFWTVLMQAAVPDTIQIVTHKGITVVTDPSAGRKDYPAWGVFPDNQTEIRNITLRLRLACPDSMRCADWDYLDVIRLQRQGGKQSKPLDYELGRLITPYGGFFGKSWYFEWEADVTEFSTLLRDSAEIVFTHTGYEANHDRGWQLTLSFEIVTGSPAAQILSTKEIWDDHYLFGDPGKPFHTQIKPYTYTPGPGVDFVRLRILQTGHGMDVPDNCAEFCSKTREIYVNDEVLDRRKVWKKCGDNPLYPQAGTWIFDRANWCPGDLVHAETWDFPVETGRSYTIRLSMEPYESPQPSAHQVISAYLTEYTAPAASVDASITEVIVPSSKTLHSRRNPAGIQPIVRIRNMGSQTLSEVHITYGTRGFQSKTHVWKGKLPPFCQDTVYLPGPIDYSKGMNLFEVTLDKPNGMTDAYPADNHMISGFPSLPEYNSPVVLYLLTNQEADQNGYSLTDAQGKVLYERKTGSLLPAAEYRDTFDLAKGVYRLRMTDTGGDGLEFWYNAKGGFGKARLCDESGNLLKSFDSDCGSGWEYEFAIGNHPDPVNQALYDISLYPARTHDLTTLHFFGNRPENISVHLVSDPGGNIIEKHIYPSLKEGSFTYSLKKYPAGRFYMKVFSDEKEIFSKRIRYPGPEMENPIPYQAPEDSLVKQKLAQWQGWKFGVIIHWGPYSEWGVVESWSLCPEDEPWCRRKGTYADDYSEYVRQYRQIPQVFNPTAFQPSKWAEACAKAGMKYVVFTTKHHDGFCMFDTKTTDYRITHPTSTFSSHPRSNIAKEVFESFRSYGMGIGAYFSKPDWSHPDYWWPYFPVFDRNVNYDPARYPEKWKRFTDFTYSQIEELMGGYGPVDILWLDGGWVRPEGSLTTETRPWLGKNKWIQDVNIPALAAMARKYQPGLLMVDRTVHGAYENYRTPEQQIPGKVPDYPWESCITLGDNWYSTGPGENYKSVHWAIHTLIKIVSKGGNFLLGIGPDKSGDLVPEVYKRLEGIAAWMQIHSAAIYATTPLPPYQEGNLCFTLSADKKTRFALCLTEEGQSLPETIILPESIAGKNDKFSLMGYKGKITSRQTPTGIQISLPEGFRVSHSRFPAFVIQIDTGL